MEIVDDDHEHFVDIVEEVDNKPITASTKPENATKGVNSSDHCESDSGDSRQDAISNSSHDISNEAEDLIMGNDLNRLQRSKTSSSYSRHEPPESIMRPSQQPGGYNPRSGNLLTGIDIFLSQ